MARENGLKCALFGFRLLGTIWWSDYTTVTKAEYGTSKGELKVELPAVESGSVYLTVVDYEIITYKASSGTYKYSDKPVADPEGPITVMSSGGVDTVTIWKNNWQNSLFCVKI